MRRKIMMALIVLLVAGAAGGGYYFRDPLVQWVRARVSSAATASAEQHSGHGTAQAPAERKVLYWVDPMHPAYKSDKPGTAPDCGMTLVPVYADEGAAGSEASLPPGAVKITAQKLQLIGVTYGKVESQPLSKTVRTVGRVVYDETKIVRIHTKVEGWIDRVFVDFTGKLVENNQPLITIYSPELVSTQQEFLIAKKAKDYLGSNPVPEISSSSISLYENARDRLRLWDISDEQIRELEERGKPTKTLTLYSPASGFVLARNAYPKQRVTPEMELYAIADLSTVWVLADIYEYELPMIQLGQTATMTLSYFPGKTFAGKVTYIYPQLDNATRTLKVRLEFSNPTFELKPDMFANVEVRIDYGRQVWVPEEAVLDSGQEQIVFVAHEGGYFEPRKVQLGAKVDGRVIVLSGLKAGEQIVTSGNFLIDSESRLKSGMAAMGHGGGHGGGAPAGGEPKAPAPKQTAPSPGQQEDHSQHGQPPAKKPSGRQEHQHQQ